MTDDQARRVDGLLASYGELMANYARMDAEIDGLQANRASDLAELRRILDSVQTSCDKTGDRLEEAIRVQGARFDRKFAENARAAKEQADAAAAVAATSRATRWQKIALAVAATSPLLGVYAILAGAH